MLRLIFSSKSNPVVFLLLAARAGLSTFFMFTPIFSSALPCVFSCTPPGPNIFSAGPRSKCMSVKSNLSLPDVSKASTFFCLQYSAMLCFRVHCWYSSGVISLGAVR